MSIGFTRLALERFHISIHDGEPVCAVEFTKIRGIEELAEPRGKYSHLLRLDGATVALVQDEAQKMGTLLKGIPPGDQ